VLSLHKIRGDSLDDLTFSWLETQTPDQ